MWLMYDVTRDMACASAARNILRSFVSASDNDYRLRCAPERFRTRVFRNLAQDFSNIVESAAMLKLERIPDFLHGIGEALKVIIEVAERMQCICRWYPPTTAGRSRRRRWLQGCEEGHEAQGRRVLGEARRMECHARRPLTAKASISPHKPATSPRVGLSSFRRPAMPPSRKSPHRPTLQDCEFWCA